MPKFNETTLIEAPREEVWQLLQDLPDIAPDFMGIEQVELQPVGRPLEVGSQLHITTSALGKVIVAHIVGIDNQAFALQTRIARSAGISGELAARLHPINAAQSKLAVEGDLSGNWLTNPLLSIGLAVLQSKGIHQIGQTLSHHAQTRRVQTRQ